MARLSPGAVRYIEGAGHHQLLTQMAMPGIITPHGPPQAILKNIAGCSLSVGGLALRILDADAPN